MKAGNLGQNTFDIDADNENIVAGDARVCTVFSFFSGCGILDLGFHFAGFEIAFVNEYFKPFLDAYVYSRKKMGIDAPIYGYANTDVNSYLDSNKQDMLRFISEEHKKGSLVGFIGGPPCPDFSIAGKQRGKNGDNGKLSLSYIQLILEMKPDFFLFENVKGLCKTARHREFYDELKRKLADCGYHLTDRLTNALEYGAPQDRDRILLFGIHKDRLANSSNGNLTNFRWNAYIGYPLETVKDMAWPDVDTFSIDSKRPCPKGICKELTAEYWFKKNNVLNHPDASRYFTPKAGLKKMLEIQEGDSNKKSYKRIHRWRYSPTVAYGNNEVHLHPYKARRLSVAEAMALQSLPKEFCLPPTMTLTDCFKTIGNGVPFVMAKGIALTIRDYLNQIAYIDVEEAENEI